MNRYLGRGILVGECNEGRFFVYFISGRSANSQNRIFQKTEDGVKILPFKPELVEDPSLIIYHPVRRSGENIVVTNGDQTDTVVEFLEKGSCFAKALHTRVYEPDAPNFTPRISAVLKNEGFDVSILKHENGTCSRFFFEYKFTKGVAKFITTYTGETLENGGLESFKGEPVTFDAHKNFDDVVAQIWASLNEKFRISLYAELVGQKFALINGNEK